MRDISRVLVCMTKECIRRHIHIYGRDIKTQTSTVVLDLCLRVSLYSGNHFFKDRVRDILTPLDVKRNVEETSTILRVRKYFIFDLDYISTTNIWFMEKKKKKSKIAHLALLSDKRICLIVTVQRTREAG